MHVCLNTNNAHIDLAIVGEMDTKYVQLAQIGVDKGAITRMLLLPSCAHALLIESAYNSDIHKLILEGICSILPRPKVNLNSTPLYAPSPTTITDTYNTTSITANISIDTTIRELKCNIKITAIAITPIHIHLNTPLTVLTGGKQTNFDFRRGFALKITIQNESSNIQHTGIGQIYDPVFRLGVLRSMSYDSLLLRIEKWVSALRDLNEVIIMTPRGVAQAVESILTRIGIYNSDDNVVIMYGFECALLHVLSQVAGIPLVHCISAYIHPTVSMSSCPSRVYLNRFTSIRTPTVPNSTTGSGTTSTSTTNTNATATRTTPTPTTAAGYTSPTGSTASQPQHYAVKVKVGDMVGSSPIKDAQRINTIVDQYYTTTTAARTTTYSSQNQHPPTSPTTPTTTSNLPHYKKWLRLDANQAWTVSEACEFIDHLLPQSIRVIDYIEEPLRHYLVSAVVYKELCILSPRWGKVKIALDETLCAYDINTITQLYSDIAAVATTTTSSTASNSAADSSGTATTIVCTTSNEYGTVSAEVHNPPLINSTTIIPHMVIKPSLMSLYKIRQLYTIHPNITLSCTFEDGCGLAYQICIAAALNSPVYASPPSDVIGGTGTRSVHGVHANSDMINNDICTKEFAGLIDSGDNSVQVYKAEELLHEYSML